MIKTKNPTIQKLIESRIELGRRFMEQSLPVMAINEDFESNILTNLINTGDNKKIFNIIKNKMPAIWTDIVDDMIEVYNRDEVYGEIKDIINAEKGINGSDVYFPLMIFTDGQDNIKYVLGGKQAKSDAIYIANDMEDLLESRYKLLYDAREELKDEYGLNFNNFSLGNAKDDTRDSVTPLPLQVFIGKLLFDIAAAYNDAKTEEARNKVVDNISVFGSAEELLEELRAISDTHSNYLPVRYTKKTSKEDREHSTTPAYIFSRAVRTYPNRYKFEDMIKPELLRTILRLGNIHTNNNRNSVGRKDSNDNSLALPVFTDKELETTNDLTPYYNQLRDVNVRNSLLFNFSAIGSITSGKQFSTFNHLCLVPDKISHLYVVSNLTTSRNRRLDTIGDIDDANYVDSTPADIEQRYQAFRSEDETDFRRHNWEVGRQPKTPNSKYYHLAKSSTENIHGNAGRTAEELRMLRRQRRKGMVRGSREINDDEARNRRADWLAAQSEIDPHTQKPKFDAAVYKDKFKKDILGKNIPTLKDEKGNPVVRDDIKLVGAYNDFMASYDSFKDTAKDSYDKLLIRFNDFANNAEDYALLKTAKKVLLKYFATLQTAIELAYDDISATGGNMSLYTAFGGNLATGAEVNGHFLNYSGFMSKLRKAFKGGDEEAIRAVLRSMTDETDRLNSTINTITRDPRHVEYVMNVAENYFKN